MIKDLNIALKNAESKELNLMISKNVLSRYKKLSKNNFGKLDTSSLIKLFDVSLKYTIFNIFNLLSWRNMKNIKLSISIRSNTFI